MLFRSIMEFGALQCMPQKPDCHQCPLQNTCLSFSLGTPHLFPVKQHIIKVRKRFFNYFFILHKGNTYLSHRIKKDIWEGLFEFPLIETTHAMDLEDICETDRFKKLFHNIGETIFSVDFEEVKHVLTHQILYTKFYQVEIQKENAYLKKYLKVPIAKIDDYAVPILIHRFLSLLETV